MIGVILAAGDGTRLNKSTGQNICKPLRKIKNTYLIEFALNNLIELNATAVYIVVGKQGDLIKNIIGEKYKGLSVYYVCQKEQKGLMNALIQALNVIDSTETVILQLSDEIFVDLNVGLIKNVIETENNDFCCGVTTEENPEKIKGNFSVEVDDNSMLIKCVEKPEIVINNIKGTGFSIFNVETQKIIKENADKLVDLCDCFNYLIGLGYRGLTLNIAKKEFNINTASDFTEAEIYLK